MGAQLKEVKDGVLTMCVGVLQRVQKQQQNSKEKTNE